MAKTKQPTVPCANRPGILAEIATAMDSQLPDRHANLVDKKVLLIDRCEATREARAAVLQSRGVKVRTAEILSDARFLWQHNRYDLVLLDVRRYLPGEAMEFYEQVRAARPCQRFAFLVGPPLYLSRTWPKDVKAGDEGPGQWAETVKRFVAAA